jgi:hypothetical protein
MSRRRNGNDLGKKREREKKYRERKWDDQEWKRKRLISQEKCRYTKRKTMTEQEMLAFRKNERERSARYRQRKKCAEAGQVHQGSSLVATQRSKASQSAIDRERNKVKFRLMKCLEIILSTNFYKFTYLPMLVRLLYVTGCASKVK